MHKLPLEIIENIVKNLKLSDFESVSESVAKLSRIKTSHHLRLRCIINTFEHLTLPYIVLFEPNYLQPEYIKFIHELAGYTIQQSHGYALKLAIDHGHHTQVSRILKADPHTSDNLRLLLLEHILFIDNSSNSEIDLREFIPSDTSAIGNGTLRQLCKQAPEDLILSLLGHSQPPNINEIFTNVFCTGNINLARKIFNQGGVQLLQHPRVASSTLQWAAGTGNLNAVQYLISLGVQISLEDFHAVFLATNGGHVEVLDVLLRHIEDAQVLGSALIWAVQSGNLRVVECLLDHGADLRYQNDEAIMLANMQNYSEMIRLFETRLKLRGDVLAYADRVIIAARNGDLESIKSYQNSQSRTLNLLSARDNQALLMAIRHNHIETALYLLSQGVRPPQNALILAVDLNRPLIVEELLKHDIDQHQKNYSVILAARNGNREAFEILYKHGADVRTREDCALISSIDHRHFHMFTRLLEVGADPCARGGLPFKLAVGKGCLEIVSYMLEQGVTAGMSKDYDDEVIQLACKQPSIDVLKLLLDFGLRCSVNTVINSFYYGPPNSECLLYLLDHVDLDETADSREVLLKYSCKMSDPRIINRISSDKISTKYICDCVYSVIQTGSVTILQYLMDFGVQLVPKMIKLSAATDPDVLQYVLQRIRTVS